MVLNIDPLAGGWPEARPEGPDRRDGAIVDFSVVIAALASRLADPAVSAAPAPALSPAPAAASAMPFAAEGRRPSAPLMAGDVVGSLPLTGAATSPAAASDLAPAVHRTPVPAGVPVDTSMLPTPLPDPLASASGAQPDPIPAAPAPARLAAPAAAITPMAAAPVPTPSPEIDAPAILRPMTAGTESRRVSAAVAPETASPADRALHVRERAVHESGGVLPVITEPEATPREAARPEMSPAAASSTAPPSAAATPAAAWPVVTPPPGVVPAAPQPSGAAPVAPLPAVDAPVTDDGAPLLDRLVDTLRWQVRAGGGSVEIRLRPDVLGAVTVSLVVDRGAVRATLSAESASALEYLRAEAGSLRESLETRGLTLEDFDIREVSWFDPRGDDRRRRDPHTPDDPEVPPRRPAAADGFADALDVLA